MRNTGWLLLAAVVAIGVAGCGETPVGNVEIAEARRSSGGSADGGQTYGGGNDARIGVLSDSIVSEPLTGSTDSLSSAGERGGFVYSGGHMAESQAVGDTAFVEPLTSSTQTQCSTEERGGYVIGSGHFIAPTCETP